MYNHILDPSQCLKEKKKVKKDLKNTFLSVSPPNVKFSFSSGNLKVQEKTIKITNYFPKPCPIQPLPMKTRYFRTGSTSQTRWLTPGSVYTIIIRFIPDEPRDYNDILMIRYLDDQILEVKIAGTVRIHLSFPRTVNFGDVPLGRAACYKIPICSYAEKQFSFAILPSKEDPCVDIYPRWGYVKPNEKPIIIMVVYRPLRYISMNFQIRIFITDLCKTPYVINFCACTRPGLLRELLENVEPETESEIQRTKISAISHKKIKPISLRTSTSKSGTKMPTPVDTSFGKSFLNECGYFPLFALHTVNCTLISNIQKPCNEHELKGPLNVCMSQVIKQKTEKLKEFLTKAELYRKQNEMAMIHHKPKVNYGTRDFTENQILEIKIQREQEWNDYKYSMKTHSPGEDLFERQKAKKIKQRILRMSHKYPNTISTTPEKQQPFLHYYNIMPFLQAARGIILRNRLLKVLEKFKDLTPESLIETQESLIKYEL